LGLEPVIQLSAILGSSFAEETGLLISSWEVLEADQDMVTTNKKLSDLWRKMEIEAEALRRVTSYGRKT
jgi:hypothetical protein